MIKPDVCPWFHPFADMLVVVPRGESHEFLAFRIDDFDRPVVKRNLVFLIHQGHVVSFQFVGVIEDQIHVRLICQHDILEELDGELGEVEREYGGIFYPFAVLLGKSPRYAAGESAFRVRRFCENMPDDIPVSLSDLNDLQPYFLADFADDAKDIPLFWIGVRTDYKVGGGQKEKVDIMVLNIEGIKF